MLAEHRLYPDTEYHQGHRANFSSADLAGRDFSGLNLRGIKMDRAVLSGPDFTEAQQDDRRPRFIVVSPEAT
jgi:pentapeptide repeat protein